VGHAVSHCGDRCHHGQHENQQQFGAEAHRNTPEIPFTPFALIDLVCTKKKAYPD
jgi:hypothetical protein